MGRKIVLALIEMRMEQKIVMCNKKFRDFEVNCFLAYLTSCVVLSFAPYRFSVWLVENVTIWLFLSIVVLIRIKYYTFSNISILIITWASILHTIGGHYSFSHVPFGDFLFLWGEVGRNNFDRFGHFFCGALIYPILDISSGKKIFANNFIMFLFSFLALMGIAGIYELVEWLDFIIAEKKHAELFIGNLDYWDPHADMLNCLCGAVIFGIIFYLGNVKNRNQTDNRLNN